MQDVGWAIDLPRVGRQDADVGLFDFLRKTPKFEDPGQLRTELWKALDEKNEKTFADLCASHQDLIRRHFHEWARVPDAIRADPGAIDRYSQGLIAVATHFDEKLGRPELLRLLGGGEDNPLTRWEQTLDAARRKMEALEFEEAATLLGDCLIDTRNLQGSGAEVYRPVTYGWLATCLFQSGNGGKAAGHFEKALRITEANADAEGSRVFALNLYEVNRWLGRAEEAAKWAEKLGWSRQAAIVRRGEPLLRVVVAIGDEEFEIEEAPAPRDRVEFRFRRNRISLARCRLRTEEGERCGSAGRFEESLERFREAEKADPYDPHPRYLAGYSLLHLGRFAEAAEEFASADALGPGWFNVRFDLWLAGELSVGRLPEEAFGLLAMLEDGPAAAEEKLKAVEGAPDPIRKLAPIRLQVGRCLEELGRRDEAAAEYRAGLERAAEPDIRTRLLVQLGTCLRDRASLEAAAALDGHRLAAAQARYMLAHERGG